MVVATRHVLMTYRVLFYYSVTGVAFVSSRVNTLGPWTGAG